MALHVAYEDGESVTSSGSKVKELVRVVRVQNQDVPPLAPSPYRSEVDTSAIDPHKLKRKIDFRLLPWLTLLYLMNSLDRGSIGNARVCTLCLPTLLAFPHGFFIPHSCIICKTVSISQISNILWRSQRFSFPMLYST